MKEQYDPHISVYRPTLETDKATPRTMFDGHMIRFPANFLEEEHIDHDLAVAAASFTNLPTLRTMPLRNQTIGQMSRTRPPTMQQSTWWINDSWIGGFGRKRCEDWMRG